jgi:hypothetical protein
VQPVSLSPPLLWAAEQLVPDCFLELGFCSLILTRKDWHVSEQSQQPSTRWTASLLVRQHVLACSLWSTPSGFGVCKRASVFSFGRFRLTSYPELCRNAQQPVCTWRLIEQRNLK